VIAARIHRQGEVLALDLNVTTSMFDRLKGWMGRSPIAERDALLIRPCNSIHTWFMRESIDVVFLDRTHHVLAIHHDVRPGTLRAHWRASAALELRAGRSASLGLQPGEPLRIEHEEA
jgi:uncharacterized protein